MYYHYILSGVLGTTLIYLDHIDTLQQKNLVYTSAYSTFLNFNWSSLNKLIIINIYYTKFCIFVLNELLFYYNDGSASVKTLIALLRSY